MSINLDIRTLLTSINSNRLKRRPSIRSWMVEFGRGSQGKLTWDGWMVSWHFSGDPQPVFFFIFFFCLFARFSVIDTSGSSVYLYLYLQRFPGGPLFSVFPLFHVVVPPHDFPNPIIIKSHVSARFVAACC